MFAFSQSKFVSHGRFPVVSCGQERLKQTGLRSVFHSSMSMRQCADVPSCRFYTFATAALTWLAASARLLASLTRPWRHGLTNGTLRGWLSCLSQDLVWSPIIACPVPVSRWNIAKSSCSGEEGRSCCDAANAQSGRRLGGFESHRQYGLCPLSLAGIRPDRGGRAWGQQYSSGVTSDFGRKGKTNHQADLAEAQPLFSLRAVNVTEPRRRSMTTARAVPQPMNQAARARGSSPVAWQELFHPADV